MKNKVILILVSALAVAAPTVVFARGSADDLPFKMMEQMFQGTPFDGVIENIPRKDRDRSKGGRDRDRSGDRERSGGRDRSGDRERSGGHGSDDWYGRKSGRDGGGRDDRGGRAGSRNPVIPVDKSGDNLGDWFQKPESGRRGGYDGGGRRNRDDDAGRGRNRDDDAGDGRRRRQQD